MNVSNHTAKRTMTEFKGLELVTMEKISENSNSEYQITLKSEFEWFLTEEFKNYREGFQPTDNKESLKSKKKDLDKEKDPNDTLYDTKKQEISITEEKEENYNKSISEDSGHDDL